MDNRELETAGGPPVILEATGEFAPAAPLDGSLWRTFLNFLGPMMLSNLLQSLSGTLNNIYVGQLLGVLAVGAVAAFFPVLFLFISFVIGLGSGASVLIGQAWGAKETRQVKAVAGSTLTTGIIGGVVVAIVGSLFVTDLLRMLGTPAAILDEATVYARITLLSMPLFFIFLLATAMMRGVGDTVTPLVALVVSTVIGLLITPALILGWLGLPKLGIASPAIASVFSLAGTIIWLTWSMRRKNHPLAPDAEFIRAMRIDWPLLRKVFRIGVPTGVQLIIMSLVEIAVLFLVNGFGPDATAAYGAVNLVLSYIQFPAISIAITASILGAQAIGAGRTSQLGEITKTGLLLNLLITGGLVVVAYLFARQILGVVLTDPGVVDLAVELLNIVLWSFIVYGAASVLSGVMRASGVVFMPMLIAILSVVALELPVAWFLSRRIGLDGVWWSYPVAFTGMFLMQAAFYWFVWRKQSIKRLV